jgi:dihydrolipoamide dehydrogenase
MDKNNITVLEGLGSFVDATHVALQKQMELQKPLKQNIIIARFETISLPFIKIDKERIITSTEVLKLPEVPKHLVIIGGGVIGILQGIYSLGAQVCRVYGPHHSGMDSSLSKELTKVLRNKE